jgi:hypothetical protein
MMKLKKKSIKQQKKIPESTQFNPPNTWLGSWDSDNLVESKSKQIMKLNSQSTQTLKDEIEKNNQLQKKIKKTWVD